jgi:hypothetical protein
MHLRVTKLIHHIDFRTKGIAGNSSASGM